MCVCVRACVCVCNLHTVYTSPFKSSLLLLVRICVTVDILPKGSDGFALCDETLNVAYEAMLTAMQDYTTDSRGDVGAL